MLQTLKKTDKHSFTRRHAANRRPHHACPAPAVMQGRCGQPSPGVFAHHRHAVARHAGANAQVPDSQRVCERPCFALQNTAFHKVKDGLLHGNLPCFKLRMEKGEWIIMITFEVAC